MGSIYETGGRVRIRLQVRGRCRMSRSRLGRRFGSRTEVGVGIRFGFRDGGRGQDHGPDRVSSQESLWDFGVRVGSRWGSRSGFDVSVEVRFWDESRGHG